MVSHSYSSGWCERCGRRRGGDGRCANCDPWWTSGLVQVGAPLLAATAALLVFVISTFGIRPSAVPQRSASSSSSQSRNSVLGAPLVSGYPSSALNTGFPSAPTSSYVVSASPFQSNSALAGDGWKSSPIVPVANPDAARWAELENLRSMVWAADALERNLPSAEGRRGTFVAANDSEVIPN